MKIFRAKVYLCLLILSDRFSLQVPPLPSSTSSMASILSHLCCHYPECPQTFKSQCSQTKYVNSVHPGWNPSNASGECEKSVNDGPPDQHDTEKPLLPTDGGDNQHFEWDFEPDHDNWGHGAPVEPDVGAAPDPMPSVVRTIHPYLDGMS